MSFYFSTSYQRLRILKLYERFFYIYIYVIYQFWKSNLNSYKVIKNYDYSASYFGVMIRVEMYMVIFMGGFVMNFKFEFFVIK